MSAISHILFIQWCYAFLVFFRKIFQLIVIIFSLLKMLMSTEVQQGTGQLMHPNTQTPRTTKTAAVQSPPKFVSGHFSLFFPLLNCKIMYMN